LEGGAALAEADVWVDPERSEGVWVRAEKAGPVAELEACCLELRARPPALLLGRIWVPLQLGGSMTELRSACSRERARISARALASAS
jgi:hypothetical protein